MIFDVFQKGRTGELKTRIAHKLFLDSKRYHIFNNLFIQMKDKSTQIDHVVVSKYGIFVIETKHKSGWIFGNPNDERWTQILFRNEYYFPNPLKQNYLHTKALSEYLNIPHHKIDSMVVFWGDCEFKTKMPNNVLSGTYSPYIKSKNQVLFSDFEVNIICSTIKDLQANTPRFAGRLHASTLEKRFESYTTCPKCGGNLLKRVSRTGRNAGQKFIGCENYPGCRYIKLS